MPKVRSGGLGYGESAWRIPVEVNGVHWWILQLRSQLQHSGFKIRCIRVSKSPLVLIETTLGRGSHGGDFSRECSYKNRGEGVDVRHLVYIAPLQDEIFHGIGFMKEHGVQLHCSTGVFHVGASLTIQPMFKGNTPSVQAFSERR